MIFKTTNFEKTIARLNRLKRFDPTSILTETGRRGVRALSQATPVDTGETSTSWYFEVESSDNGYRLIWKNSITAGRVPLVILLQYGHGTRDGHWVPGKDFINPALDPVFAELQTKIRNQVKRL